MLKSSGTLQRLAAAVLASRAPAAGSVQVLQCSQIPEKGRGSFRNLSEITNEGSGGVGAELAAVERKKLESSLLYRSRQRGFLELDLLVGLWAQRHIKQMTMPQLQAFAEVLQEENPDLFKWLTGQEPPSAAMRGNAAFLAMQEDIGRQLQETRPSASATKPGKTWLRGWDDWRKDPPTVAAAADAPPVRSQ